MFWWSCFDWKLCNYLPFFSSILFSSWIILVKNFLNLTCHFFKEPLLIRSLLMTEDFHPRNFVSVLQIWNSFPFIFSLFWSSSWFFFLGGVKIFQCLLMFLLSFSFFFMIIGFVYLCLSFNFLSSPSFLLLFLIFTFILFPLPLISLKCLETIYAVSKVKNSKDNSACPLETDEWQIKRILK